MIFLALCDARWWNKGSAVVVLVEIMMKLGARQLCNLRKPRIPSLLLHPSSKVLTLQRTSKMKQKSGLSATCRTLALAWQWHAARIIDKHTSHRIKLFIVTILWFDIVKSNAFLYFYRKTKCVFSHFVNILWAKKMQYFFLKV